MESNAQKAIASDSSSLKRDRVEHVVLLIHGINSLGNWTQIVGDAIKSETVRPVPTKYGYFPVPRFLAPWDASNRPIDHIRRVYRDVRNIFPDAKVSVIAHSFGTYLLTKSLKQNPNMTVWRVILCGSVVEQGFDWSEVAEQIGEPEVADKSLFILNDCGNSDYLPVLAASAGWRYGNAGTDGFSGPFVHNRYHYGNHGLFFTPDFIEKYWKPFIEDGTVVQGNARQGEQISGWMRRLTRLPWRWAQPLTSVLALGLIGWLVWFVWLSGPERIDDTFVELAQDFKEVRRNPKDLAEFTKQYAGKRVRWQAFVHSVHPGDEPYYMISESPDTPVVEQTTAGFAEDSFNPAMPLGEGITIGGTIDEKTNALGIILRDCDIVDRGKSP
jgi:hypothetical protein